MSSTDFPELAEIRIDKNAQMHLILEGEWPWITKLLARGLSQLTLSDELIRRYQPNSSNRKTLLGIDPPALAKLATDINTSFTFQESEKSLEFYRRFAAQKKQEAEERRKKESRSSIASASEPPSPREVIFSISRDWLEFYLANRESIDAYMPSKEEALSQFMSLASQIEMKLKQLIEENKKKKIPPISRENPQEKVLFSILLGVARDFHLKEAMKWVSFFQKSKVDQNFQYGKNSTERLPHDLPTHLQLMVLLYRLTENKSLEAGADAVEGIWNSWIEAFFWNMRRQNFNAQNPAEKDALDSPEGAYRNTMRIFSSPFLELVKSEKLKMIPIIPLQEVMLPDYPTLVGRIEMWISHNKIHFNRIDPIQVISPILREMEGKKMTGFQIRRKLLEALDGVKGNIDYHSVRPRWMTSYEEEVEKLIKSFSGLGSAFAEGKSSYDRK